ncbi:helix-turn-helix domain-containing protein, partial [Actinomadura welshii]
LRSAEASLSFHPRRVGRPVQAVPAEQPFSPRTALCAFFGAELRRKREQAGLTGKELADALGCTPQWISTMESGRKVSEQSALDLDTYFKTDGCFHRMWKLINDVELQTFLPPGFTEYAEREKKASSVRVFSALLVNGLFRSDQYARSIIDIKSGAGDRY